MASRSQTEQQQQVVDIADLLKELEQKIERLKTLYEQYFMGIEKMEPQVARKEVTRVMLTLQQQYIRNTAVRFRFNTMLQKWNIYVTYWNRVLREIENGTYVRHLAKVKRKAEREGRDLPSEMPFNKLRPPSGAFGLDEDTKDTHRKLLDHETGKVAALPADDAELEEIWDRVAPSEAAPRPAAAPAAPPPPAARAPSRPPPLPPPAPSAAAARANSVAAPLPKAPPAAAARASSVATPLPKAPPAALPPALPKIPGMNESELRTLHQRYVDAQKASGAAASVKYETLVNSLAKQVPNVLSKPGVRGVRFDVTVENGKPVLKAIPQK